MPVMPMADSRNIAVTVDCRASPELRAHLLRRRLATDSAYNPSVEPVSKEGRRKSLPERPAEIRAAEQRAQAILGVEVLSLRRQLAEQRRFGEARCRELAEARRQIQESRQLHDAQMASLTRFSKPQASAESRLRVALTSTDTTTTELRQAIAAVSALLEAGRRELANRELRERRAAHEALYVAMEAAKDGSFAAEVRLDEALAQARLTLVEAQDLARGEEQLQELRNLSPQEREAKVDRVREAMHKDRAFLLAKRNESAELSALLDELEAADPGKHWRCWLRAGRSLWQVAQEPGREQVRALLGERLGLRASAEPQVPTSPASRLAETPSCPGSPCDASSLGRTQLHSPCCEGAEEALATVARIQTVASPSRRRQTLPARLEVEAPASSSGAATMEANLDLLKARAFRAVVRNEEAELAAVIAEVPLDVWSTWTNKAGVCLLQLAEERRSAEAHTLLATALGLVSEIYREVFEDRESVWIFMRGDVQARRATVLQDTPAEADVVLVEFWDDGAEAQRVPRCQVRKMHR